MLEEIVEETSGTQIAMWHPREVSGPPTGVTLCEGCQQPIDDRLKLCDACQLRAVYGMQGGTIMERDNRVEVMGSAWAITGA